MVSRFFPARVVLLAAALMTAIIPAALAGARQFGMEHSSSRHRVERHQSGFATNRPRWRNMEHRWTARGNDRRRWRGDLRFRSNTPRLSNLPQANTRALFRPYFWPGGNWQNWAWRGGEPWRRDDRWRRDRRFDRDTVTQLSNLPEPNTRALFRPYYWPGGNWQNWAWRGGEPWRSDDRWRRDRRFDRDTVTHLSNLPQPSTRALFRPYYWPGGNWQNWAWRGDGRWRGDDGWRRDRGFEPYNVMQWQDGVDGSSDGYVSTLPSIGTYVGGIAAYPEPGNGIYFTVDNARLSSTPAYQAPSAHVLTVTAENADAACSYEEGVCVIRP